MSLFAEACTWYAFASIICLLRIASCWTHFARIRPDDVMVIVALAFYTILVVFTVKASHYSHSITAAKDPTGPFPTLVQNYRELSKIFIVVEQCLITTVWLVKACFLCILYRIADGRIQVLIVKGLIVYVGLTFVVLETLFFGHWCLPFHHYWDYSVVNAGCTVMTPHLIAYAAFDMSSDLVMLALVIPLLVDSQRVFRTKIAIMSASLLAALVIFCAAAARLASFTSPSLDSSTPLAWYIRESSTALILVNLLQLEPLFRRVTLAFRTRSFSMLFATTSNLERNEGLERGRRGTFSPAMSMGPLDGEVRVLTTIETCLEKREPTPFEETLELESTGYTHREAWDVAMPWAEGSAHARSMAFVERTAWRTDIEQSQKRALPCLGCRQLRILDPEKRL